MFRSLFITLLLIPVLAFGEAFQVTGVAATVNGMVITRKEVAVLLAPRMAVIKSKYPRGGEAAEKEFNEAQAEVLDQLIENKIILSAIKEKGASIPDYVVDQEVQRIVNELYNGDESAFRKTLIESGATMRSYKKAQQEKILVQAMKSEQFGSRQLPPTPDEISAHYHKRKHEYRDRSLDKITFSKIFVPSRTPEIGSTAETQLALAEKLAQDLKNGADFAETARKYSADAYASDGGKWPETIRTDFDPSFAQLMFDSPVGKVSGPFKDPRGFTIVKVHSIKYGPSPAKSKIKDRLVKEIQAEKYNESYQNWIEVLKKKAIIDKRL